jgi:hypothetical protein
MAMKPNKRRCPQCLGPLTYSTGCRGRKVPSCDTCKGYLPRGGEGYWIITTDPTGTVNGTMEPPKEPRKIKHPAQSRKRFKLSLD